MQLNDFFVVVIIKRKLQKVKAVICNLVENNVYKINDSYS